MNWNEVATNLLKAELTRRGISYDMLQEKLSNLGIQETANSINAKINRGTFSFVFFLQCSKAIGISNLRLDELIPNKIN